MSAVDYVRMTIIPNNGATTVEKISEVEACAIRDGVFMRRGHVVFQSTEMGCSIKDDNGTTILHAVLTPTNAEQGE